MLPVIVAVLVSRLTLCISSYNNMAPDRTQKNSLRYLVLAVMMIDVAISCDPNSYAVYRLMFEGLWTKERFPKVYPDSRPKAEWSTVIGRTHNPSYSLFSMGEMTSSRLKPFVENGITSQLNAEGQGTEYILDSFSTQNIESGEGSVEAEVYSQAQYSQLSLVAKIVPSPDWFVGIDSLPLCSSGQWIRTYETELWPLDAGTQRGYTFSSPKWKSDPVETIRQITSSYPNHTADAFYYPLWSSLPAIARVRLQLKMILHRMDSEVVQTTSFGHIRGHSIALKPPVPQVIQTGTGSYLRAILPPRTNAISVWTDDASDNRNSEALTTTQLSTTDATTQPTTTTTTTTRSTTTPLITTTSKHIKKLTSPQTVTSTLHNTPPPLTTKSYNHRPLTAGTDGQEDLVEEGSAYLMLPSDDEEDEGGPEIVYIHVETGSGTDVDHQRTQSAENSNVQTTPTYQLQTDDGGDFYERECLVSEWSHWSECSQTCGYGKKVRSREIVSWTGNVACPELQMEQLCGSMKKCNWNHFSLTFNSSRSLITPNKRRRPKRPRIQDKADSSTASVSVIKQKTAALTGKSDHRKGRKRIV